MTPILWLALGVVLMAVEIIAPGFIVFWFGLGGIFTALLVFFEIIKEQEIQWLFFFSSSLLFIFLWFAYFKKKYFTSELAERDPTLIQLSGVCVDRIEPKKPGTVELFESYHGLKRWKAESSEIIEPEEEIQVIEATGIRLVVKKVN
ncbi:MAG: hypothetical protein BWY23_02244 [Spirochaetes bacterium ADurb.Bin218]|jgi:membrane protein implicated in regulation of membrane protease activity|nr:hypothetical protein [Spirochaetota bacterium]OQA95899.1 MAG: hypothetical protein BWY23_02244 [Spirochaetes bacterium ADurb.Bin218]HOV09606.1 NfeD family protein [Spirochaetota bacterium]HPX91345.1 NfeD family protein [Spirochaetota bacterium]